MEHPGIRAFAVSKLQTLLSSHLVGLLLPLLFQLMVQEPASSALPQSDSADRSPLVSFLFTHACADLTVRFRLYWHFNLAKNSPNISPLMQQRVRQLHDSYLIFLTATMGELVTLSLLKSSAFADTFRSLPQTTVQEASALLARNLSSFLSAHSSCPLPVDPRFSIRSFLFDRVTIKPSQTRPVILPVHLSEEDRNVLLCYKFEDVRKDQLILLTISLFADILRPKVSQFRCTLPTCGHNPCPFLEQWEDPITYSVVPISCDSGFLEFVSGAETLADITQKKEDGTQESLQNWLIRTSVERDISRVVRPRFIRSMAFWTVVSCLLGLADRHLKNIMMLPTGQIFHIDFGWVLGVDPKPMMPPIRITQEMVDCMGNYGSADYHHFKQLSIFLYSELRHYYPLISQIIHVLSEVDPPIADFLMTKATLHAHLERAFLPNHSSEAACAEFDNMIERSWSSFAHNVNDLIRVVANK